MTFEALMLFHRRASSLIVSISKGKYTAIQFVENGKAVKKVEVGKKP